MQFDQDIGPWNNDEIRSNSCYNYSHSTSFHKNQCQIKPIHHFTHQINSERKNLLPRIKLNNITSRVTTRQYKNESVKRREESLEQQQLQQPLPQLLQNKELLYFKKPRHKHTEFKVVLEIEKIIRRNLFYVPTHKFTTLD